MTMNVKANADASTEADFSLALAVSVHDMKNSMGMLMASLDEIFSYDKQTLPVELKKQLATVQYEASRINVDLVKILSVYRLQHNRLPIHIDNCFIAELLEEQVLRNQNLIDSENIHAQIVCEADLTGFLDVDLVASIINDALINACRYTKNEILVGAEAIQGYLHIYVADNGSGFPEKLLHSDRENVFEKDSLDRTHLGIYFAEKIAAMHRHNGSAGYIKLTNSEMLSGGLFSLYLPM
ncbi:HAMP domain-containing sensor histidine kinase [Sessilibacter sp. MAH1]